LRQGTREQRVDLERVESPLAQRAQRAYDHVQSCVEVGGTEALDLVEALIASAPDSDAVAVVSAGPLEELVYDHGAALVDEDVAACLALLQSEQLTGSVVDRLWQRIVERLSGEGLLGAWKDRDVRQALNDMITGCATRSGEYDEPPTPEPVPEADESRDGRRPQRGRCGSARRDAPDREGSSQWLRHGVGTAPSSDPGPDWLSPETLRDRL
jgi:hypothetical protein